MSAPRPNSQLPATLWVLAFLVAAIPAVAQPSGVALTSGHAVDAETRSFIMKVASQKNPYKALEIREQHRVHKADDLPARMNIPARLLHAH